MSERKRDEFIDSCWAIYDEVDAYRATAGLLKKWRKELFKGDALWMLRSLSDLSVRGYLNRGDSYVYASLKGIADRGRDAAPPTRTWVEMPGEEFR